MEVGGGGRPVSRDLVVGRRKLVEAEAMNERNINREWEASGEKKRQH